MLKIIIGKTMSGKTTFVNKHMKPEGYNQVITHTTRPMRPSETSADYHFETDVPTDGSALALREYDMIDGHVAYWTTVDDIETTVKPVLIIDVQGALEIAKSMSDVMIFYVNTPDEVIKERLFNSSRGKVEDLAESKRRYDDDVKQFAKLDDYVSAEFQVLLRDEFISLFD
jgi:Guanylate kinase